MALTPETDAISQYSTEYKQNVQRVRKSASNRCCFQLRSRFGLVVVLRRALKKLEVLQQCV